LAKFGKSVRSAGHDGTPGGEPKTETGIYKMRRVRGAGPFKKKENQERGYKRPQKNSKPNAGGGDKLGKSQEGKGNRGVSETKPPGKREGENSERKVLWTWNK